MSKAPKEKFCLSLWNQYPFLLTCLKSINCQLSIHCLREVSLFTLSSSSALLALGLSASQSSSLLVSDFSFHFLSSAAALLFNWMTMTCVFLANIFGNCYLSSSKRWPTTEIITLYLSAFKTEAGLGMVAHTCNPSYLRGQKDQILRAARQKVSKIPSQPMSIVVHFISATREA
jgi:hypothetical protein